MNCFAGAACWQKLPSFIDYEMSQITAVTKKLRAIVQFWHVEVVEWSARLTRKRVF